MLLAEKLLSIYFVQHMSNNVFVKVFMRSKGHYFLIVFIEDTQEYIKATEGRQLDYLFIQDVPSFDNCYFPSYRVLDIVKFFLVYHEVTIYY